MDQTSNDFSGTERFRIRRRLGSGGMGVVYEAHDRQTDKVVALKALTRTEASHIARFKNEFRSLADVSHPNLVALYEFMSDGAYWFFTMELVRGVNFLEHVRPGYKARHERSSITPTLLRFTSDEDDLSGAAEGYEAETRQMDPIRVTFVEDPPYQPSIDTRLSKSRLDLDRLALTMRQLAEGLHALHQTGKLHRDMKPSNVLVTKEDRVVILDFGLVAEVTDEGQHDSITLAGTPDYMSPEQGAQLPISTASDWYSVGVMLYQALTGRLPFYGKFFEVMVNKQNLVPVAPAALTGDMPDELNDLCMRLLQRNPEARPSGREVLRVLGHGKTGPLKRALMPTGFSTALQALPFVGRAHLVRELFDAYEATRRGQPVTIYVHGDSGMGKTALVRHFLDQLRDRENEVVILEGRCYERESVPYKALDGVVDSLTNYLMALPDAQAETLMPRDALALARLFPVLLQVDAVFNAPQRQNEIPDPFTLRRRGFAALRELFQRISERQPLVIYIDDLHWSDADSTNLLEEILRPPDAPPLLLLASFPSEEIETKPFLQKLLDDTGTRLWRELHVAALTSDEARDLAGRLLGDNIQAVDSILSSIVHEARGNPFLLEQLARYAATSTQTATNGVSLEVMLYARLRNLPKGTRQFVEALAVASRPINPEVAYLAAGLTGDELPLVSSLRAAQLLRSSGLDNTVELYHNRIREAFYSQLNQATIKHIHRSLALALEAVGVHDPEALFDHYLGAGERVRAAAHAAAAAKKAADALAFDRAAAFYRRAIELSPGRGGELVDLKRGLAEALVNAGRPAEAAQAYLDVAQDTSASLSLDFKRRAAEQLLMGGHIKEGLEVIRSVLAMVGLRIPAGRTRAVLSLALKRVQIRLRGLNFRRREAREIPEADLFRIDICWALAAGLGAVDLIRGADFQGRHLLLALKAGEPYRVARAIAFEAAHTAARGERSRKRALHIAQRAEELAQEVGDPHAIGLSMWARGIGAYLVGHWKQSAELCERAADVLRDRCTGATWELTIANRFMLSALLQLGEIAEISRRVPALLTAALEQGNLLGSIDLRTRLNLIWLASDEPNRAREEVIEALKAWPHDGYHLQHYSSMLALAQIELYTRDAEVAWKHIQGQWKELSRSMLLRIQVLRIEAMHLRARAALATAATGREKEVRLKEASRIARRIARESIAMAVPFSTLVQAGVAWQRGQGVNATALLTQAVDCFDRGDIHLYAAATRRRLGEAIGGERGRQLISEADAWMQKQGIKNPAAMTSMLAPGFD